MRRRSFLKLGTAGIAGTLAAGSGLISWIPRARASVAHTLYITDGYITQPDGKDVYFRGFSSSATALDVPGEQLVCQQGDTVTITVINTLNTTHRFTIDGFADTGDIAPGQQATVQFTPGAGTEGSYLYYDSSNAPYNRLLGLHGGLAVMPANASNELYPGSPTFVQQYFWLFNDIDPVWHGALHDGTTPTTPFKPRYFTVNGLSSRPPNAPGNGDPGVDAMADPRTVLVGSVGDRALVRLFNCGHCTHGMHVHANHMEWLTYNGKRRQDIWKKDILRLDRDMGQVDAIYPFEQPPDAYPPVNTGTYPMHLHDEMTQTAGGGLYLFGAMGEIHFV
ncbi:MAG TPA: multicopper oxidase domain-containing protein [Gammaproteobacteria bacterium]|nr:multicopper oxidase domain-containing protein [Gammaproteobacteria bacterium]